MATIGTLIAKLGLETASFHSDMGKAVSALNSSAARMNQTLAGMERSFKRLNQVAGIAITGFVTKMAYDGVKSALEFAEALDDTAKSIGIGTTALQEFRYVLQQNGATFDETDKALQKFSQTIGDAANGSRTAQQALYRLSITADDLKSKSVDKLFVQATDNLSKFSSESDRNSAALDVFGDKAKKITGALATSSVEMARLRAEAHAFGAILSEQTIAKAQETKDKFDALSNVLKVQLTEALVNVGPLLVKTAKFLSELGEMANWAALRLGLINPSAEQQYDLLLQKRLDTTERIAQLEKRPPGSRYALALEKEKQALVEIDQQLTRMREGAKKPASPTDKPAARKVESSKEYLEALNDLERATKQSQLAIVTDERIAAYERMAISRDEMIFKLKQQKLWVEDGREATKEQQAIQAKFRDYVIALEQEAAEKAESPMQKLAKEWSDVTKQMEQSTVRWAQGATDALTEFALTGKASFTDFANSILRDLLRIAIQKSITGPLFASMESGGFFSGISSMLGFADGGSPPVGRPSIVGERGPELFVPKTAGTIVPNHALGGGVNVEVNVINQSGTPMNAENRGGYFEYGKLVVDVVLKDIDSYGPLRTAIASVR